MWALRCICSCVAPAGASVWLCGLEPTDPRWQAGYHNPMRSLTRPRGLFGKHPEKVSELITLREGGMSTIKLGHHFDGMDHTTIRYALQKFAPHLLRLPPGMFKRKVRPLSPPEPVIDLRPEELEPETPKPHKYAHLLFEDINPGRDYREYRQASAKKKRVNPNRARLVKEFERRVKRRGLLVTPHDRQIIDRQFSSGTYVGRGLL